MLQAEGTAIKYARKGIDLGLAFIIIAFYILFLPSSSYREKEKWRHTCYWSSHWNSRIIITYYPGWRIIFGWCLMNPRSVVSFWNVLTCARRTADAWNWGDEVLNRSAECCGCAFRSVLRGLLLVCWSSSYNKPNRNTIPSDRTRRGRWWWWCCNSYAFSSSELLLVYDGSLLKEVARTVLRFGWVALYRDENWSSNGQGIIFG